MEDQDSDNEFERMSQEDLQALSLKKDRKAVIDKLLGLVDRDDRIQALGLIYDVISIQTDIMAKILSIKELIK